MSAFAALKEKPAFNWRRYVARGMMAEVLAAVTSTVERGALNRRAAKRALSLSMRALQQPRHAPGFERVARHGSADVGVGCENHAPGRFADERHGLCAQVRDEMQNGTRSRRPVDGERTGLLLH